MILDLKKIVLGRISTYQSDQEKKIVLFLIQFFYVECDIMKFKKAYIVTASIFKVWRKHYYLNRILPFLLEADN